MPTFSEKSLQHLAECHEDLQKVLNEVIKTRDFTILCGFRNEEDQEKAFNDGLSKLHWPKSAHNQYPSNAVDIAPFPLDWSDSASFYYLAGYVLAVAEKLGVKLRFGGDWNGDGKMKDEHFRDLVHFELA